MKSRIFLLIIALLVYCTSILLAQTTIDSIQNSQEWLPLGLGLEGLANSLAMSPDGTLYVGGEFNSTKRTFHEDGDNAYNIAKWDGASWSIVANKFETEVVSHIVVNTQNQLYVGLNAIYTEGSKTGFLVRWDKSTEKWTLIDKVNQPVFRINYDQGKLFLATMDGNILEYDENLDSIKDHPVNLKKSDGQLPTVAHSVIYNSKSQTFWISTYYGEFYTYDAQKKGSPKLEMPSISGASNIQVSRLASNDHIKGTYAVVNYTKNSKNYFQAAFFDGTLWTLLPGTIEINLRNFGLTIDKYNRLYFRGNYNIARHKRRTRSGKSNEGMILYRYDTNLKKWKKLFRENTRERITAMVIDPNQNLYVAGRISNLFTKNTLFNGIGMLKINIPDIEVQAIHVGTSKNGILPNTSMTIEGVVAVTSGTTTKLPVINKAYLEHNLLWIEKGMATENFVILDPVYWGDYVFNDTYDLKSLKEVKTFIKENGHLPGIPSEKEIIEQGYSQHDMSQRFMVKIEELFLYAIQQKMKMKEIIKLKHENMAQLKLLTQQEQQH